MSYALAAAAGIEIVSGIQQAEIIRQNAQLSKQVNDLNAGYAEIDAYNTEKEGYSQETRYQTVIDESLANQKVTMASDNIDINFGTASQLQGETKLNGFLNKVDIVNQAHMAALGYKNQASAYRMAGANAVAQGAYSASATQNAGLLNAARYGLPKLEDALSSKIPKDEASLGESGRPRTNTGYK